MTGVIECRYYGRDFTADEMALLRALIAADPQPTRAALSREFCRRIGWFKPDGGLKDMMAKVTMLAMHRDGVITLPPPRGRQGRPKPIVFGPDTEPPLFPPPTTLDEIRPLEMRIVVRGTREGSLWNEFVARYHYLGYKPLVGAQMRYAVHDRNGWPIAMLGFSTAAWKLAPRDNFIGWTPRLREKNLPLVVDNATPVGKTHLGPRLIRRHAGTPGVAHLVAQDGGAAVVRRHSPAQRRPVVARHGGQILRRGRRPAGIRLDLRRRSWRMFVRRAHLEGVQSSVGQIREVVRRRESCRGPCCVRGHSGAFGMAHLVAHDG